RINLFVGREDLLSLAKELRLEAYENDLTRNSGWLVQTALFPAWSHKGLEANLAYSDDLTKPLLANRTINMFFSARSLGAGNEYFNQAFNDLGILGGKYANINGATIHETNEAMTMPNVKRMAEVSPTVLFEFNDATPEVRQTIKAFCEAFVEQLSKETAGKDEKLTTLKPVKPEQDVKSEGASAEEIMASVGGPSVASLNATATSLLLKQEDLAKEGKVLIVRVAKESGASTDLLAQRIGQKLDDNLKDLVINIRATKVNAVSIAADIVANENIRSVVFINEDSTLIDTEEGKLFQAAVQGLHEKSRVLDVQSHDGEGNLLFVPIPAIYDLALRLGFEQDMDNGFAMLLSSIGMFLDTENKPIDPFKMSTYFVIRIIPRVKPANINADAEAQKLTKDAVEQSL
ncbi:MAG: hypothetical protein WCY36_08135, partial [Candidatus Omnitrophota bacterium]